jgi:hypothetical protein
LITHIVTYSVDLNGEMCLRAIKIEYVWADRMLAAKHWLARKTHATCSKVAPPVPIVCRAAAWRF